MRKLTLCILVVIMLFHTSISSLAIGEGNVDGGGGGMGSGTTQNMWIPGEDGVRVSVIRITDNSQVSQSFDLTNIHFGRKVFHFGIYSKLQYRDEGVWLVVEAGDYRAVNPTQNYIFRKRQGQY